MKKRLDVILVELGLFDTRNKAQANILAGNVKGRDRTFLKAGELFDLEIFKEDILPFLEIKNSPYVSRGAYKLVCAVKEFNIDLKDRICIDIGASTGGFVDCMLQAGAKKVYAVDVGYNQLDWKLKTDERVINIEKTNARDCSFEDIFKAHREDFEELPDFLSMDVSFISIKKVLPNVLNFVSQKSEFVLLIKPQFEAEQNEVMKGGVVKDEKIHKRIIEDIKNFALSLGLEPLGGVTSPIAGNKSGNIEYLIYLKRGF